MRSGFRDLERQLAKELGQRRALVIATGGRMMLDPGNVVELTRNGRVFCLLASSDEIHRRVTSDELRRDGHCSMPTTPERGSPNLSPRSEGHARFPQVDTDHRDVDAIAEELAQLWSGAPSTQKSF